MTRFSLSDLRARLLFLVLLATVPAFGLFLYSAAGQRQAATLEVEAHVLRLVRVVSVEHERLIESTRHMLMGLARLQEVRDPAAGGCSSIFADLRNEHPSYANLGAAKRNGDLFCSALEVRTPINIADRAYFRRAVETRGFVVGDYQVGRATGKATINFGYPVTDGAGEVRAVVFAALDLAWLNHLAAGVKWPDGSTITVLDGNGVILARHPDVEAWVGQSVPEAPIARAIVARREAGTFEAAGFDGKPRLFAFAPLGGLDQGSAVYVTLGIPKDVAFADIDRSLRRSLVALALVAVLALAAAWIVGGGFILRPVNALLGATRRVAAGELSARAGPPYAHGELGKLAHAFDEMAEALERRRAEAEGAEEALRRQREALYQSEKLAAMGQLLAGVAHELNNPLSVIMGRVALLRGTAGEEPLAAQAEKIAQAAERCARIVKNFLALARQTPMERQPVALNHVVEQAVELLAYPLRLDNVEVVLDVARDLPIIWADPHQLHQVVVNLVSNGHQAMRESPPPRRLTVTTRSDQARARIFLEVADMGPGIPGEMQPRIFEPFFTTKPVGQGLGLGLSLCRGIVEAHGGTIGVESRPQGGAVFRVELPVEAPLAVGPEGRVTERAAPIPGKTILIVDDEPEVAATLADLLRLDGHRVVTAANGDLALRGLEERAYDVIMSDIRMPELDGPGFYRQLERRDPRLLQRFIFLTGDALTRETTEFLRSTRAPTLSKPFSLDDVRTVVQRVLTPAFGG